MYEFKIKKSRNISKVYNNKCVIKKISPLFQDHTFNNVKIKFYKTKLNGRQINQGVGEYFSLIFFFLLNLYYF